MKQIEQMDSLADERIAKMMATMAVAAYLPAAINWTLIMGIMGAGAVSIGKAYGFKLSEEDGSDLVRQFFVSAGTTWLMLNVGSKIVTALIQFTGVGYFFGATFDAAMSCAQAYAVGGGAKTYFRKKYQGKKMSKKELGMIFREKLNEYKSTHPDGPEAPQALAVDNKG